MSLLSRVQANRRYERINRGKVVLIVDDGFIDQYASALPAVEAIGGKLNFAIVTDNVAAGTGMSQGAILDAYNRGHEIIAHSKSHINMTAADVATRATEWASKATIETWIPAGACKSWVYPLSTRNSTTDKEAWLRFDHALSAAELPYVWAPGANAFLLGRFVWSGQHAGALALVQQAYDTGVTVIIYTHRTQEPSVTNGVTAAQFAELVALCDTLDVPMVTLSQAFPAWKPIKDAGAEDSTLFSWTKLSAGGALSQTMDSVVDTPDTGLNGTRSLHLSKTGSSGNVIAQSVAIPVTGGVDYTFGARVRYANKTTGSQGVTIAIYEFDAQGTAGTITTSTLDTATFAWALRTVSKTLSATTAYVKVACRLVNADGDAYFDHLHFDRTDAPGGCLA